MDKETVDRVLVRAEEKRVENFAARGPGVRGIGGGGGGDGVRSWLADIRRRVELAADVRKLQLVVRCWSLLGLFIPHTADGRETNRLLTCSDS